LANFFSAKEFTDGMPDNLALEIQRSMDFILKVKAAPSSVKQVYIALDTMHQDALG